MAKGTETLKEARDIIEEMNLNIDRFNQGLKNSDGFTKKMTKNIAEQLQGLEASRKSNKMNGKHLGAVADLGKEILDGNIDSAKSMRLQDSLTKKLSKTKSTGAKNAIKEQISMLKTRDKGEKIQKKVNSVIGVGDKLTGGMASKAQGMLQHVKKVGPGFAAAGIAAGGLALIVGLLIKSLKFASALTDAFGAQFGVAGTQSSVFKDNLTDASIEVISLGKGTTDVVSLVDTLSKDFGITLDRASELPNQILDSAVALGLSTDEGAKLFGTLMSIGNLTFDQAENLAESTYQLAQQNNVNPSAVMRDISDSAELIAKFGADNVKSIAKAAVQARQLGLNLNDVDRVSESLLDFQSSISNEIEASIMIGKQLNLQKARELALTGDLSGMMDSVLEQLGGEAEFNKLNVLQRKSLAKSIGLEVTQMQKLVTNQGKTVKQQKSFADLAGKDGMSALTNITNQVKELGAQFLIKFGVPLENAVIAFRDEFMTDENIARIKTFIESFADTVVNIAKGVGKIFNFFKGIANLFSVNNLLVAGVTAAAFVASGGNPFIAAAAGGTVAAITDDDGTGNTSRGKKVNDFKSAGGSHLVVTPTGEMLKTNPRDTVFGTTAVNDFSSGPAGSMGMANKETNQLLSKLIEQTETLINETKRGPDRIMSGMGSLA
tara:strand:- start:5777 stop:7762 length:1986 start_codon:yes stop_codon:yes gene_type:complete